MVPTNAKRHLLTKAARLNKLAWEIQDYFLTLRPGTRNIPFVSASSPLIRTFANWKPLLGKLPLIMQYWIRSLRCVPKFIWSFALFVVIVWFLVFSLMKDYVGSNASSVMPMWRHSSLAKNNGVLIFYLFVLLFLSNFVLGFFYYGIGFFLLFGFVIWSFFLQLTNWSFFLFYFLKIFLGSINVRATRKEVQLKVKEEYKPQQHHYPKPQQRYPPLISLASTSNPHYPSFPPSMPEQSPWISISYYFLIILKPMLKWNATTTQEKVRHVSGEVACQLSIKATTLRQVT